MGPGGYPLIPVLVMAFASLAACGRDDGGRDNPAQPGLAFEAVPATASLNGRFTVVVRLNDERGEVQAGDSGTIVAIHANGGGTLQGTLSRTAIAGRVTFD